MKSTKEMKLHEKWKQKNEERVERMRIMKDIMLKEKSKAEAENERRNREE